MLGTTQRRSVTTTGRGFQTRDAEMNLTRLVGDLEGKCMSKLAWKLLTKKRGSSTSQGIPPGKEALLWVTGILGLERGVLRRRTV